MSNAQAWLVVGGLVHLVISMVASYVLYWARVADPHTPAPRYAIVAHKVTLWNGFLLLGLSVAIEHTGFDASINTLLAIAVAMSTLLADASNLRRWAMGMKDQFIEGPDWRVRAIGLTHMVDLLVITGILYGVVRTALGI